MKNTSLQGQILLDQINQYIVNRRKELKRTIIQKTPAFRERLLRNYHRSTSPRKKMNIGISPQPYLDLISNPFDTHEWYYLSLGRSIVFILFIYRSIYVLGPSYIRVNQSAIRPRQQQEIEINNEHNDIYMNAKRHLVENPSHIPSENIIFLNYSNQLRNYLQGSYLRPRSYQDHIQAKQQADIFRSIPKKIRQQHPIICFTDKSNHFYIGSHQEFQTKVQKYFSETNAYIEILQNPYDEVLNKVIQLLNQLRSKKLILQWQYNQMMPDPKKVELAHLYFNPKTHKVYIKRTTQMLG